MSEITNAIPGIAEETLRQFIWRETVTGWVAVGMGILYRRYCRAQDES